MDDLGGIGLQRASCSEHLLVKKVPKVYVDRGLVVHMFLMAFCRSIFVLLVFSLSAAQLCAQDRLAYGDRGNRFEGHRRIEVAAPALEVLSFYRGGPLSALSTPTTLKASFYLPQAKSVSIQARELVTVHFYNMEAKQTAWPAGVNVFGPWKSSDVIDELGVSLGNIGVLGRVRNTQAGSGEEIVALSFSDTVPHSSRYELVFRVKYDVKKVSYRVEHLASGAEIASGLHTQAIGGAPLSIQFDLPGALEGQYRLILDCLYKGRSGGPLRIFEFYHKP